VRRQIERQGQAGRTAANDQDIMLKVLAHVEKIRENKDW
jgi:hypothetical protein